MRVLVQLSAIRILRVLHILDHSIPTHSGYAYRTKSILSHQRLLGIETDHVTSAKHDSGGVDEEMVDGLRFFRTELRAGRRSRSGITHQLAVIRSLASRLHGIIDRFEPDILHAHSPCLNGIAALGARKRFDIPLVYELRALWEDAAVDHGTAREGDWRYCASRALETYLLRRADAITTICEGLRDEITARITDDTSVTVIPNAVDVARFRAERHPQPDLAASLGLDTGPVIGFIGSLINYEGVALILEAVPALLESHPSLRVLIVGDGTARSSLEAMSVALGVDNRVVFAGSVPHERVEDYYDLIDICVYARLPIRLTELVTPLKPLEAMAKKKLVVASDVGGHRELIRDGETGLLFEAGSVDSLRQSLERALEQLKVDSPILTAAREFVETERTWHHSVSRYADVYQPLQTSLRVAT